MDELNITDKWVEFIDKRIENDVLDLLSVYMIEFNAKFNRNKRIDDFDLAYSFFDLMCYKYNSDSVMG